VGWEVSDVTANPYTSAYTTTGGTIKNAGDEYSISGNVSFIARYQNLDITLVDNASNGEVLSTHNGMTAHGVTLSGRTLYKDGGWNTLCLPFSLASLTGTPLEGATVKTLESSAFANGTLTLNFSEDNLTAIEAGKPYLVKWSKPDGYDGHESDYDLSAPVFTGVTISNATSNVRTSYTDFIGTYSPVTLEGGDNTKLYLGSGNTLYYPSADWTINACRAYFALKGIEAGEVAATKLYFGDYDSEDGIMEINNEQLIINNEAGAVYDLSGRKITAAANSSLFILHSSFKKGIYIRDGRKVLF
jgi:hypothetical protein